MDPPPYTPEPTAEATSDTTRKAERMYQFFLENMAFAYGVPQKALLDALASQPLCLLSSPKIPVAISPTTEQERKEYLPLCELIRVSRRHIRRAEHSLITDSDYLNIYHQLVLPCEALQLRPAYVGSWLAVYGDHQFNPMKRLATHPYELCACIRICRYTFPFPYVWDRETLRRRLAADDFCVERFSPNEQTQLLLGSAIARIGGKHLGNRRLPCLKWGRGLNTRVDTIELITAVLEREGVLN